jgi:hypothetical protein
MAVKLWYADDPKHYITYMRAETYTYPKDQIVLYAEDGDIVEALPMYRVRRVANRKQGSIVITNTGERLVVERHPTLVGDMVWEEGSSLLNFGDWSPSR